MTWQWVLDQGLPIALLLIFGYGVQRGDIIPKSTYDLMVSSRDEEKQRAAESRSETKAMAEKLDLITKQMAEDQAQEREALVAEIATLRARLDDVVSTRKTGGS